MQAIMDKMTQAPIVIHPLWGKGYTILVHTDSCGSALGYMLEQLDINGKVKRTVAFSSKKDIRSQLNCRIYDSYGSD